MRVLLQTKDPKNKISSLYEPHAYAVGKGKDHKKWEYGTKASLDAIEGIKEKKR